MAEFIEWIKSNFLTILVSALIPILVQLLQYRKTRSESGKLDSESKKVQSETEKIQVETDGLMIKNATDIVEMWEGAYKELKEKTDECVENNRLTTTKVQYLLDSIANLKSKQRAMFGFITDVLDAIQEPKSDVFCITDEKKMCLYISPNVFQMLGYSPLDFLNRERTDLIHPDDLENFNKTFFHSLQFPEITSKIVLRYKNRDGEYLWIESTVMNLLQTHVRGIFFSSRDITRIKNAETEFKRLFAE